MKLCAKCQMFPKQYDSANCVLCAMPPDLGLVQTSNEDDKAKPLSATELVRTVDTFRASLRSNLTDAEIRSIVAVEIGYHDGGRFLTIADFLRIGHAIAALAVEKATT